MNIKELKERIKKGQLTGAFLFGGEEEYLIRHYTKEIENALIPDKDLAPFAHYVYHGAAVDFGRIADTLQTPSMMTESKLVVWHNADFNAMKDKDFEALEEVCRLACEWEGNTLLFISASSLLDLGTEKRPTKLRRTLSELCNIVLFEKSTDAQLSAWLARHFEAEGVAFAPSLPQDMIARVGHSMELLALEVDKLICYAKATGISPITRKELEFVTVSTVESDAFSLSNAILNCDTVAAFRYLGEMKRQRTDPILLLGQIAKLYGDMLTVALLAESGMLQREIAKKCNMHEYKAGLYYTAAKKSGAGAIKRALLLCQEADRTLKTGTSSYIGIERLIAAFAKTP
ncbi:MAG: DNA polymerase III subunit delta [Clostridia bacterium]|nr:DNA polymerase III subunit delta [Clostridia bacterium]